METKAIIRFLKAIILLLSVLILLIFLYIQSPSLPNEEISKAAETTVITVTRTPNIIPRPTKNSEKEGSIELPSKGFSLSGHWRSKEGFGSDSPNKAIVVDYYFSEGVMTELSRFPNDGDIHISKYHYTLTVMDRTKGIMKLDAEDLVKAVQISEEDKQSMKWMDMNNEEIDFSTSETLFYVDSKISP